MNGVTRLFCSHLLFHQLKGPVFWVKDVDPVAVSWSITHCYWDGLDIESTTITSDPLHAHEAQNICHTLVILQSQRVPKRNLIMSLASSPRLGIVSDTQL